MPEHGPVAGAGDPPVSLVALRCRTAERSQGVVRGVEELTPMLADRLGVAPRPIGSPGAARALDWREDLEASRGCLLEAGGQVEDALGGGRVPVLVAGDCSVALTTLPAAARMRPEARVLWLDAHADFNRPDTTPSGYLGGMALSGACGLWDAGLRGRVSAERLVLAGVRELDREERALLERSPATVIGASLETLVAIQNALDRAPVFVHLDLDVIDPDELASEHPAPGGLGPDKLYDLLEAAVGECELVGLELTGFLAPEDRLERQAAASTVTGATEPLLAAALRGAHVSH